jgi:hypothetical protein
MAKQEERDMAFMHKLGIDPSKGKMPHPYKIFIF